MKVLGLVPYFSGTSSATNSAEDTRRQYLEATVESLWGICDEIIVGTCQEEFDVNDIPEVTEYRVAEETPPEWLPAALLREIKRQEGVDQYDLFYVTEADQVLHIDKALLDFPRNIRYLVPHRMEELYEDVGGDRGEGFLYDERKFVIANGRSPAGRPGFPQDGLYKPREAKFNRFGGAFLAHRWLFMGTDFVFSWTLPVEHATGLDIAESGVAWKTMQYDGFWVEHLSGREYHEKLYNLRERTTDGPDGSGVEDAQDQEGSAEEGVDVQVSEEPAALPSEVS